MEGCNLTEVVAVIATLSTINAFNLLFPNTSIIITIISIIKTQTLYTISTTRIINRNFGAQCLVETLVKFLPNFFQFLLFLVTRTRSLDKTVTNSSSLVYFVSHEEGEYNI